MSAGGVHKCWVHQLGCVWVYGGPIMNVSHHGHPPYHYNNSSSSSSSSCSCSCRVFITALPLWRYTYLVSPSRTTMITEMAGMVKIHSTLSRYTMNMLPAGDRWKVVRITVTVIISMTLPKTDSSPLKINGWKMKFLGPWVSFFPG